MDLADLMAVLYGEVMKFDPKNPRWEDRDWLVLSKGHAGPVAYATFGLMGFYPMEEAYTLNQPHTKFPSHTDRKLTPGVDLTTGSLGQGASAAADTESSGEDELLPAAVDVVLETGQASVSMLQRRLKLGYSRAARLVDQMEERGIVGPFEGSKPRQLLITRAQWDEMQMGGAPAVEDAPPFDTGDE